VIVVSLRRRAYLHLSRGMRLRDDMRANRLCVIRIDH
jgi:hypothetical protein